ncbi:hypothetical protein L0P88_09295 [Muricauda sp. SCSIO 64092]|uniref:hypothetical protein n=1 Tax=Allomuricauda sp. SCSIO 64092 TaxID=2908842 RepID=UPI001FF2BBF4|nr:hypothetical protein [Muricauda sp. SCSIO 64092]UOY08730.1 hypothetical protein L0P88_09295 [Muricauda sp. SCSIO 64092]
MKTHWKNIIALFFLASFLLLRVVNLHSIAHFCSHDHEDMEHCGQCAFILSAKQGMPLQATAHTDLVFTPLLSLKWEKRPAHYKAPYRKTHLSYYYNNKAPPFYIKG